MYRKVIIAVTAIAIGVLSSMYSCRNITQNVVVMWGFMYPRLCFAEGTYYIDGEPHTAESYKKLLNAEKGQIKVKFKLLELLEERR